MRGGVRFFQVAGAITTLKLNKNLHLLTPPKHCCLSSMDSAVVIRKKKRDKHFEQRAEIWGPRAEERNGLRKIRTHQFHYDLII